MAGELIWSRAALDDIDAIAAFIARDSRILSRRMVERIFEAGEQLLAQPMLAKAAPEANQGALREHQAHSFRILFEQQGDDLHLLAITFGLDVHSGMAERARGYPPLVTSKKLS